MASDKDKNVKFISLFSGIDGFALGFEQAGLECALQVDLFEPHLIPELVSDYENKLSKAATKKQANKVRRDWLDLIKAGRYLRFMAEKHWPDVPKINGVQNVTKNNIPPANLICGGFPCQDISIAGRREGLAGERSGLWFEFHRIITEAKPEWVVIENVPGLLSSNGGRDMGTIVGGLAELGYWWAYRVLDAQFFGVPQRRRRVFIVASLTAGRPQEVLFERESSPWDIAPSREAGQSFAKTFTIRSGKNGGGANDDLDGNRLIAFAPQAGGRTGLNINIELSGTLQENQKMAIAFGGNNTNGSIDISTALNAHGSKRYDFESETFICNTFNGYTGGADDNDAQGNHLVTCFTPWDNQSKRIHNPASPAPTLAGSDCVGGQRFPNFATQTGVRRLTPLECERLQGFPDGWTEGQSDSARYRQLGNAVAVPVTRWIGERIMKTLAI